MDVGTNPLANGSTGTYAECGRGTARDKKVTKILTRFQHSLGRTIAGAGGRGMSTRDIIGNIREHDRVYDDDCCSERVYLFYFQDRTHG